MRQTKDQLASLPTLRSHLLPTIWTAFALVLLGILLIARPAPATASPLSPQAHTANEEEEWEEVEEEVEEGEEWEETENEEDGGWEQIFDQEELEEEASKKGGKPSSPSTECPLGSVKPKAFFERARGDLHLVLRYTADSPTSVDVDFWLKGGKGPLQLGSAKRQLNENGVLQLDRHLGQQAQGKIDGTPVVIVQVKAPTSPSNCRSQMTKRLSLSSGGGHQNADLLENRRA